MLKILLISGHGAGDPGACSSYGIESNETRRVVNRLKQLLANYMTVTVYPQDRNCYADVVNGTVQVNMSAFDYVFEVHFNSGVAAAHGTEIWVTPQESSTKVEQGIVNNVAALGFTNRGVKSEQLAVINYAKRQGVSSALIETCFISNQSDMQTYNAKFDKVCEAIAKGIVEGFDIKYVVANNTTTQPNKIDYKGDDVMFNEGFYLKKYPDVAEAVKKGSFTSGYEHYKKYGQKEKRLPVPPMPTEFNEAEYLELNPDVAKAVKDGSFVSGAHHYLIYGWEEKQRKVCKAKDAKLQELEDKINKIKELVK